MESSNSIMNNVEIYYATMDVVRRAHIIAEVLKIRGSAPDSAFAGVENVLKTFLKDIKPPIRRVYDVEMQAVTMVQPPWDDQCEKGQSSS
jgi:hypothetical protein